MNYSISAKVLEEIKKSKNILISTHKNPDYDSIASVLSLQLALNKLGKNTKIISCQKINPIFFFLEGANTIEMIDFMNFKNFINYDLFIIPDTGSYDRVTGSKEINLPQNINYLIIDHHKTNDFKNPIKIFDELAASTTEVIYRLLLDLKAVIDPQLATLLLTGILGDTLFLRYCENRQRTMRVVNDLVDKGADMDFLSEKFYEQYDLNVIKLLGEFFRNIKKESYKNGKFVWSAVNFKTYESFNKPEGARELAADLCFRGINDTSFGVAMLESKLGVINLSFRSKKNTDVTLFASVFGGGGHKNAAGATVKGDFKSEVKKIVDKISSLNF